MMGKTDVVRLSSNEKLRAVARSIFTMQKVMGQQNKSGR